MLPALLLAAPGMLWRFRYVVGVVLAAVLLFGAYKYVYNKGYEQHEQETEVLRTEALAEARMREDALTADAAKNLKEKDDALKAITRKHDNVVSELRQRPPRRTGADLSQAGTSCEGGTGAGLSGPDAGFLIGEASRAAQLQAALNQCYKQYEDIEKSMTR